MKLDYSTMKIALLDLNHTTCGIHTATAPLGIGLISVYVKKNVNPNLDIKLFKEINKILETLKSWIPDVIGIAQYSWNSELNLYAAKLIKNINPNCAIIGGGPNFELSAKEKNEFLKSHNYVDICVSYDGEIPFATIIKRLLSRESIDSIKKTPPAGTYSLDPIEKTLTESPENPPRLDSLDVFGPIYADGVFDDFLKEGYCPFVQTHRGCPFTCAFCHTSDRYYTKMLFLSPEIFKKDMEYLGKFFAKRHDITLYIANTNMSLFEQDFEIAKIIREIQDKYDWPKFIDVNSGKNPQKLLDMLSIIQFNPSIALQTLTPQVLENIRRRNLPFKEYCAFQEMALRKTKGVSSSELILCLPGETKETFLQTLKSVMNSGVQGIFIYTLMNLKGTPLASGEFMGKYSHVIKHRIVPRQFSDINGQRIFDTEEVIVGTKDMPFEDYIALRGVSFVVNAFFNSTELIPLKRFMLECHIDIAEWIFNMHKRISEFSDLKKAYDNFLKETREELFPTRKELIEFYGKDDNYNELLKGVRGDNLLRKYMCLVLSENFEQYIQLAIEEAQKLARIKLGNGKADKLIDDFRKYLLSRDLKPILSRAEILKTKRVKLNFDIPQWLEYIKGDKLLEEFQTPSSYLVEFSPDSKKKLNSFMTNMNKDKILSLQILYRDGGIRNFWPNWIKSAHDQIPR